jgi:hypothetical protein
MQARKLSVEGDMKPVADFFRESGLTAEQLVKVCDQLSVLSVLPGAKLPLWGPKCDA